VRRTSRGGEESEEKIRGREKGNLNFFRTSWKGMGIFLCGSIRRPACEN
jgi:hypothetical protein